MHESALLNDASTITSWTSALICWAISGLHWNAPRMCNCPIYAAPPCIHTYKQTERILCVFFHIVPARKWLMMKNEWGSRWVFRFSKWKIDKSDFRARYFVCDNPFVGFDRASGNFPIFLRFEKLRVKWRQETSEWWFTDLWLTWILMSHFLVSSQALTLKFEQ